MDEIGLAREECGRLEHVYDLGRERDLGDVVDVGEDRHADRLADLLKDSQPFVDAGPAIALVAAAIGLVEARLEDEVHAEAPGDFLQLLGCPQLQFLALDDAWAGDQEQRLVETDGTSKQVHGLVLDERTRDCHWITIVTAARNFR